MAFAAAFVLLFSGWLASRADAFVHWTNEGSTTIGRSNLDGSAVNQSFITGASGPESVAVDGRHVYWNDESQGTIGRSNLDGVGASVSFITGAGNPVGVAVDGPAYLLGQRFQRHDRARSR